MMDDELKQKILTHYQNGEGSIQDIARVYRVTVQQVLDVIGEGELNTVHTGGDMIDETEAGPGASMNYGRDFHVPYDVN